MWLTFMPEVLGLQVFVYLGTNMVGGELAQFASNRFLGIFFQSSGKVAGFIWFFVHLTTIQMVDDIGNELAVEVGFLLLAGLIDKGLHGIELEDALPHLLELILLFGSDKEADAADINKYFLADDRIVDIFLRAWCTLRLFDSVFALFVTIYIKGVV